MRFDDIQMNQENEYSFPYHFVVNGSGQGFSQCFNDTWGINYLATIEYLLERFKGENFSSVLDVGCGDGRFTAELGKCFADRVVVGVDYSARAISLADSMTPGADFRCADIVREDIGDRFDLAVLMEVFEHVHPNNSSEFLEAIADLLNPGAILYLTVPHMNKPVEAKHYRHFNSATLVAELDKRFDLLDLVFIEKRSWRKKLIDTILTNRIFVLNNKRLGGILYRYYKNHLFLATNEASCQRMVVRARRRLR